MARQDRERERERKKEREREREVINDALTSKLVCTMRRQDTNLG